LAASSWIKEEPEKQPEKPIPAPIKKIDTSFLENAFAQQPKERAQTIRQPVAAKSDNDDFKNSLAALLDRGR
jgi:hypothetical protein